MSAKWQATSCSALSLFQLHSQASPATRSARLDLEGGEVAVQLQEWEQALLSEWQQLVRGARLERLAVTFLRPALQYVHHTMSKEVPWWEKKCIERIGDLWHYSNLFCHHYCKESRCPNLSSLGSSYPVGHYTLWFFHNA